MKNVEYQPNQPAEKIPHIKNKVIERMGDRIASEHEVTIFNRALEEKRTHHATGYYSKLVEPVFMALVEDYEKRNGNGAIEFLKQTVYKK